MKPASFFILLLMLTNCFRFDPDRDSNLADLHITIDTSEAVDATLKLNVVVYNADTLVASDVIIGPMRESYSVLFPRLKKNLPYTVCAFGSCITGEDTEYTDVWSILPLKRYSYLRAERIPHSYGALDWLGAGETTIDAIVNGNSYPLKLQGVGEVCQLVINDWKPTDSYSVYFEDKIRIKIGVNANLDFVSELSPVLPFGDVLWLYLFNDPASTGVSLTRQRDGVFTTRSEIPSYNDEMWRIVYNFNNEN